LGPRSYESDTETGRPISFDEKGAFLAVRFHALFLIRPREHLHALGQQIHHIAGWIALREPVREILRVEVALHMLRPRADETEHERKSVRRSLKFDDLIR